MKFTIVTGSLLCALGLSGAAAAATRAGVPLLVRSDATDDGSAPARLVARDRSPGVFGARLVAAPDGKVTVSFARGADEPGRYAYLGFGFTNGGPFGISVTAERPLASQAVFADGQELRTIAGSTEDYVALTAAAGSHHIVIRLERGSARETAVTVRLRAAQTYPSLLPNPPAELLNAFPEGVRFDLAERGDAASAPADVMIPAIVRTTGLHGPIRSRLSLLNRADAPIRVQLRILEGSADTKPVTIDLPARSKTTFDDVVAAVTGSESDAQGVLAIAGFVPGATGDLVAETAYDNGAAGRLGTTLPIYDGTAVRASSSILSASTESDPRVILFSDEHPFGGPVVPVTVRLTVETADGQSNATTVTFATGTSVSHRLRDLAGADGLVTLETDDASVHAVLVRSDPVTGSPFLTASN